MSMWKKSDTNNDLGPEPSHFPVEPVLSPRGGKREAATIGPSISVRGDVSGQEDLIVQGQVEGTIMLKENNVIVGKDGRVKANVHARTIEVEGQVEGDLHGEEQVVVRRSGNIRGNVVAPRVTLEDGCRFKGSIDMDVADKDKRVADGPKIAGIKPAAGGPATGGDKEDKRGAQASGS